MKKIVTVLLTLALVFGFSTSAFATPMIATDRVLSASTATEITPFYLAPNPVYPGYVGRAWVTAEPYLHIRTGPGNNYPIITTDRLDHGDMIYVDNTTSNNWVQISPGKYVSGYYLERLD